VDRLDNPFAPGAGTQPPELAGRDDILDALEFAALKCQRGGPTRCIALLGLRGVGKTVVLGRVRDDFEERGLLAAVANALKTDGLFALELPQKQPALDALKASERFGSASNYTEVQRSYDAEADLVTEQFHVVTPSQTQTFRLRYRLFSQEDAAVLLCAAGLRIGQRYAGYTCAELTEDSPNMLLICERCL